MVNMPLDWNRRDSTRTQLTPRPPGEVSFQQSNRQKD
jgi:hypothetical protein